ncbi:tRNA nuclease WapA (plasmid) [Arthrobacter sp. Hiyo8]|nr:tRNA nuclease WapA [Arthrobacter sp. Hiyo8]
MASLSYTRDNANQITGQTPTGLPGAAETDAYNNLNQLKSVTSGGTTTTNAYDAANNASTLRGGTQTFDAANQLCWSNPTIVSSPSCASKPAGASGYGYDNDGNRTISTPATGSATTYTYNGSDELTKATTGTTTTTYAYNAGGLRTSKTTGTTTTSFTWDDAKVANLLTDGTNTWIHGPGGVPLEQISGTQLQFFFTDQIGSTRALTDNTGNVVATYSFDAYGKTTGHTGTSTTPLQYTGGYTDTETSYIYLRARYYDTNTAQFLTKDPAYQRTLQWFAYAGNNPLNIVDPLGLWGFWDTVGAIGLGVAIVGLALTGVGAIAEIAAGSAFVAGEAVAEGAAIGAEAADAAALASESADAATAGAEEASAANAPREVPWAKPLKNVGTAMGDLGFAGDAVNCGATGDDLACAATYVGGVALGFGWAAGAAGVVGGGWDVGSLLFGAGASGIDGKSTWDAVVKACSGKG